MTEESKNRIARFFLEERSRMVNYVRRLINDAADRDGEDIVHDVMCSIFDTADISAPIDNLSAYVFQSLRNRVIDLLRKKRKEISLEAGISGGSGLTLGDILSDIRYDTAADYEKKEMREAMMNALGRLNEEDRAIIMMTDFEGHSFRRISEDWDVPIGTLLSRKSRAMKKLKKSLEQTFQAEGEQNV
jgi:RNA polymerase sigma factor (sigma-70 family)